MSEQERSIKRAKRRAKARGKDAERWVAEKHSEVWPGVERRRGGGRKENDITDDHTPFVTEVKKRGGLNPWSAFLENALVQAEGYASMRHDPAIPLVVLVNSPGPGKANEARVYMDHACWLEREKLIIELQGTPGGR